MYNLYNTIIYIYIYMYIYIYKYININIKLLYSQDLIEGFSNNGKQFLLKYNQLIE